MQLQGMEYSKGLVRLGMALVAVVGFAACGGGGGETGTPAADSTTAPPAVAPAAGRTTFNAADITPAMVALGDSIFHGQVAMGLCQTCHGPNGKGLAGLGADLTDATWLHNDGSWQGIHGTVVAGVPKPDNAAAPMLPMGGSQLTPEQVDAVSAYVYSLSHKVGPGA